MGNLLSLVWDKLGESCELLKQETVTFFRHLSKKTDEALNNARRFFDNFSEKFKETIVKSKCVIDETMQKAVEVIHSMKSMFCCSFEAVKNKISQLIKSLIAWLKKLWDSIETFFALMKEVALKTFQRCKEVLGREDDCYFLLTRVVQLLQLMEIISSRSMIFFFVALEAFRLYKVEPNKIISEMKFGNCFKNLEDEKKAALFIQAMLIVISSFKAN